MSKLKKLIFFISLKKCVDLYNKRMMLDNNDIYLLDKSGRTIYFNAMHEVNYDSKIFIFNKTFYKERLIKIFEENIEKINTNFSINNNLNYLPNSISSLLDINLSLFDSANANNQIRLDKFSITASEIKKTWNDLLDSFESAKNIFRALKINVKICDKIKDNYNYQYNSLESIYKNISVLYEQCYNKNKELEAYMGKLNEKNDKVLEVFKDSIDKLKSIELHAKMQTAREQYLIDIYFDESKMNVWKEKCVKSQNFYSTKIKAKGELILGEKLKIRYEKNTNILQLKNDWHIITSEYENFVHDKEKLAASIICTIYEDIINFHKNANLIAELLHKDSIPANLEEAIENIKNIRIKFSSYKDLLTHLTQHNTCIEDFSKKMKNLLIKSSVQINVVFTNYHIIKKNLLEIMEKVEKYSEGLTNLEKDFSYLSNPSYFPQAYHASIIEIKRRLIFNKKITKDFERLKQLIVKENLNRKQFIQDYGKYLTHDYVPQLKFSDLKLSIEFSNQDEILNMPNILDEEEENALNSNNIYLDYDEFIGQSHDSLMLARNNPQSQSQSQGVSNNNTIKSIRKSSEEVNLKKNNDYEDTIRSLNAKISELEIVNSIKENEVKKILNKLEQRERKITVMHSEIEKLSSTIENVSDNFLKQLNHKDQKLKEKTIEFENIMKVLNSQNGNKLDNCPMCRDIVTNSIDYQGWGNFVKDYHEKLHEKNKILSKIENRYQELVTQTCFIKKTFFTHLNSIVETKNMEIMNLSQNYENKLMIVEDFLTQEKSQNEFEKKTQSQTQMQNIQLLETRLKDLGKLLNSYDIEIKNLKKEKENMKKIIEESKFKENNLQVEFKLKDSKYENILNDYKSLEKQHDQEKKNINQLSEEIITKVKENTNLKCSLENQIRMIDDLEKAIESYKINHIETLNEVHKANQQSIEKLNLKIDEMTQTTQEKFKSCVGLKILNEELNENNKRKDSEKKQLLESLDKVEDEFEVMRRKFEELKKTCESNEMETNLLKKRNEEIQINLTEKEKKLQEFTELAKFFSTNDHQYENNKVNFNTNNEITSDNTGNTLSMAITNNLNLHGLTKLLDSEELVNVKRLEIGLRSIFVPHSPGVYVSVNLNPTPIDITTNYDSNYEINKYYKCNSILNIDSFDSELKELLRENSLIIIGKVGKLSDLFITSENNPYQLPEDNTYTIVDLDKVDYIIGFQGDEMIFRNYLF